MSDRQRILEHNRSLRTIKSELEKLLEGGVITDEIFDGINNLLPVESTLSGVPRALPPRNPSTAALSDTLSQPFRPLKSALATLNIGSTQPISPPAYSQTGPPPLPVRATAIAPKPKKPVLVKARAMYPYQAADSRDVALEKDDVVDVFDYVNNEWWMGQNTRTGEEGIFPRNYVQPEQEVEKSTDSLPPPMQVAQTGSLSGPPAAQVAYNADGNNESKLMEQGSKFGKKIGNAAIFGAGTAIGGKIVDGLF